MRKIMMSALLMSLLAACTGNSSFVSPDTRFDPCEPSSKTGFEHILPCYQKTIESQPLDYVMTKTMRLSAMERRSYRLFSQSWSPGQQVYPQQWEHDVTLYIPDHARQQHALLVINNGIRYPQENKSQAAPTNFTDQTLETIANNTRTVVISVSDIPNQALSYTDDHQARIEDDSVAHSWTLFMHAPHENATVSLHIPMMASASRVMTLVEREMLPLNIQRFVVTGASKRAWATWLAAITDKRVEAIVPIVLDFLNIKDALRHMYFSYGGNWPIAFTPYYNSHIDTQINSEGFQSLMQIEDPLNYLNTRYASRLAIPKYIVNASGDDFFVPDNSNLYYDKLPGTKILRMVPNAGHGGLRDLSAELLITFLNRFQGTKAFPVIKTMLDDQSMHPTLSLTFSELPKKILLWQATNPDARDFRYACGIRYFATPINTPSNHTLRQRISLNLPDAGWQASFVEATFADGFVATSKTYILGKQTYPTQEPPKKERTACQTLPGRGFGS